MIFLWDHFDLPLLWLYNFLLAILKLSHGFSLFAANRLFFCLLRLMKKKEAQKVEAFFSCILSIVWFSALQLSVKRLALTKIFNNLIIALSSVNWFSALQLSSVNY